MEKIEKTENKIVLKGSISETIANSIRRYCNQIPILAVEEIEITKNDSALYDEALAHRIGLIPLKSDKIGKKNPPIEMNLESKGEKVVCAEEFKGKVDVVYGKIPLTNLLNNQEIQIKAIAKAGKGSEHSKYSPGLIFYRKVSEISLDKSLIPEIKEILPTIEIKEKGDKAIIIDEGSKEISDVCEGIASKRGKKADVECKEGLIWTIESFGQISPENMFKKSIETLKEDLDEVSKAIEKI